MPKVEVIAHRGAGGPENTLKAFRRAREMGADWFECDVRLCATGEPVVIHDRNVNRTTNGTGHVDEMPMSRLLRLNAGSGQNIPTLHQSLALAGARFGAYIEAKVQGNAAALAHAIVGEAGRARGRVVVQSFDTEFLEVAAQLAPRMHLELLLSARPRGGWQHAIKFATRHGLRGINVSQRAATRGLILELHEAGLRCAVFTVNDAATMRRIVKWGANALITDNAEACLRALKSLGQR
ncbi:MAG: hypothetical protein IT464_04340 [Planctomycetes bacterium]|nr:hypothetical protein [Planctomycetota bacterium]